MKRKVVEMIKGSGRRDRDKEEGNMEDTEEGIRKY
jgi:hypothetical protein